MIPIYTKLGINLYHLLPQPGFFNFMAGGCEPCNCNEYGVVDPDAPCNPVSGQCSCIDGQTRINSRTCDGCPKGFFMLDATTCQSMFSSVTFTSFLHFLQIIEDNALLSANNLRQ